MKFSFITFLAISSTIAVKAQSISLRANCPDKEGQWKATCASYAPVYTALSTQYNASHGYRQGDSNFTVFSYGFVASQMKADKSFFQRIFSRCGKNVTADMALEVLKNVGTVLDKQFPDHCSCSKQRHALQNNTPFRITSWQEIGNVNMPGPEHIKAIKESLNRRIPVVTAIWQTPFFRQNEDNVVRFPEGYITENTDPNHVVCIVGYDDNREEGAFLVKNNYTAWGNDKGFAWVKYPDMLRLIRYSYNMSL